MGTPFGAGIGRLGDLCGALTGALVAYGLARGRNVIDDLEGKEKAYAGARRIYEGFREPFGAVKCRDLTGVDFDDPESAEKYEVEDMQNRMCAPLVRGAVALLVTEFTDKP